MQTLVILRNGKVGVRILVCCCRLPYLIVNTYATTIQLYGNNKLAACKQLGKNIMGVRKLVKNWESVGSPWDPLSLYNIK